MSRPFLARWYNSVSYSNMLQGWETSDPESFEYNWLYDLMKMISKVRSGEEGAAYRAHAVQKTLSLCE